MYVSLMCFLNAEPAFSRNCFGDVSETIYHHLRLQLLQKYSWWISLRCSVFCLLGQGSETCAGEKLIHNQRRKARKRIAMNRSEMSPVTWKAGWVRANAVGWQNANDSTVHPQGNRHWLARRRRRAAPAIPQVSELGERWRQGGGVVRGTEEALPPTTVSRTKPTREMLEE